MIVQETKPGTWLVTSEDENEAQTLRALFSLKIRPAPLAQAHKRYDDFAALRADVAAHWDQQTSEHGPIEVFEPFEDPVRVEFGLRCRRTQNSWTVGLQGLRKDSSKWVKLMLTPEHRRLFATHPKFGTWVRRSDPLAVCEGFRVTLEPLRLESVDPTTQP